jgi:ketosteroid isomerase-like protein
MLLVKRMMRENVDVLRGIYDAFNRRDVDGLMEGFHPEIEIVETEDLGYAALLLRVLGPRFVVLSGRYRGLDEVRRLFETVWEISDWFRADPEEFIDLDEQVVVPLRLQARARETGLEGEAETAHLWTMQDAKGLRLQVYAHKAEALEAAGISR